MGLIKKEDKKETPAISTASLPDIVFMLLFFFMVATKMKEVTLKVEVTKPEATETTKVDDPSLVRNIYIGKPSISLRRSYGTEPRIQLGDVVADVRDIGQFISDAKGEINEAERNKMTVSLKIDKGTRMGIVNDVKEALRDAEALKISYSATKVGGDEE
jgi:biopolymer transport protein ExbD